MKNVLIRQVDDKVLGRLTRRAHEAGRSVQAELRLILEEASRDDRATAIRRAAVLRQRLARRRHSDSGTLQSQDRAR